LTKLAHFSANIASRTRRGGQSSLRYSRLRDGQELAFLRKVVERTGTLIGNVKGLVIGGKADMKRKFLEELPRPLRRCVLRVIDLDCDAGLKGLRKAALQVDDIASISFHETTQQLVTHFLGLVAMPGPAMYCYGEAQTAAAVRMGAVDRLLLSSLSKARSPVIDDLCELAAAHGTLVVEMSGRTEQELHFCRGFGVGGCLRWPVNPEFLEDSVPSPLGREPMLTTDKLAAQQKPMSSDHEDSDHDTLSTVDSPRSGDQLFIWFQGALNMALADPMASESLVACAQVMLAADTGSHEEVVIQTVDLLRAENVPEDLLAEFASRAYARSETM